MTDLSSPSDLRRVDLAPRPAATRRPRTSPPGLAPRFQVWTKRDFDRAEWPADLSEEQSFAMRVVAEVLPFRVNRYVVDELIDWDAVPEDPMFQLVFPQPGMLDPDDFARVADALRSGKSRGEIEAIARDVRARLNPHPGKQQTMNVPVHEDEPLEGLQHKYRETVLYFPRRGQTCHSYCTFCFRWAQFVGHQELLISGTEPEDLRSYLSAHPEVSDVIITGGDPLVMKTRHLEEILDPLLRPEFEHLRSIRIGTKALGFWPYRFLTDSDADDLLRLFERVVAAGRNLAVMAHFDHWRELRPEAARRAVARIRSTGAEIRTQAPILRHINDDARTWERMWREQVRLGMFPYYMFVERDTGARHYFEVPLARAWEVYRDATVRLSGLGRTARGPSMSTGPGKVEVLGVTEIAGERVFNLRFLQGRDPEWVQRPFYAAFDPDATWLDDLRPALGEERFFFEDDYRRMVAERARPGGAAARATGS